jgi:hypothetical protein
LNHFSIGPVLGMRPARHGEGRVVITPASVAHTNQWLVTLQTKAVRDPVAAAREQPA